MGVISTSTFDPLRRYVAVRLQQGVPIVDADVNEREDVRRFELRAFLKWFVGDGVPEDNEGFRIEVPSSGMSNDFTISAGITGAAEGLRNVGRCLVDGLDVMIAANVDFAGQPLHESQPTAATLAAMISAGGGEIEALATPGANGQVLAYLDVWERLVDPTEDPALVHTPLGLESCARVKREWAVRVRPGTAPPLPGDSDFVAGHSYYPLATIRRRSGDDLVLPGDIDDRRERRLLLPPATLIEDLFAIDAREYRQGRGRPPISLRAAINALIRGEIPATAAQAIAPDPADDDFARSVVLDAARGVVVFWHSTRGGTRQVHAARASLADPDAGFPATSTPITTGALSHRNPRAVRLSSGDLLVVYETEVAANNEDIHMRVGPLASLPTATEIAVATGSGRHRAPLAVAVENRAVLFYHDQAAGQNWRFINYDPATSTPPFTSNILSVGPTTTQDLHAAVDRNGITWAAYVDTSGAGSNIQLMRLPPGATTAQPEQLLDSGNPDENPFVLPDRAGNVWIFWIAQVTGTSRPIEYRRLTPASTPGSGTLSGAARIPGSTGLVNARPWAVEDRDGTIWLFFTSTRSGNQDVWVTRRDVETGAWSESLPVTGSPDPDVDPAAILGDDTGLWLFWSRALPGGNGEMFHRRIFTRI